MAAAKRPVGRADAIDAAVNLDGDTSLYFCSGEVFWVRPSSSSPAKPW